MPAPELDLAGELSAEDHTGAGIGDREADLDHLGRGGVRLVPTGPDLHHPDVRAGQRRRGADQALYRRPLVVEDRDGAAQVVVVTNAVVFDARGVQRGGDGGEVAVPLFQRRRRGDDLGPGSNATVGHRHPGAEGVHGVAAARAGERLHQTDPPVRGQQTQQPPPCRRRQESIDLQGDHALGRPLATAALSAGTPSAPRTGGGVRSHSR
ncbi:hypothetical protein JNW90_33235 [Micromonospora sp. STR1s_5]|nr:hypothetical protein [Micromonospora sp. STR1s_5]